MLRYFEVSNIVMLLSTKGSNCLKIRLFLVSKTCKTHSFEGIPLVRAQKETAARCSFAAVSLMLCHWQLKTIVGYPFPTDLAIHKISKVAKNNLKVQKNFLKLSNYISKLSKFCEYEGMMECHRDKCHRNATGTGE